MPLSFPSTPTRVFSLHETSPPPPESPSPTSKNPSSKDNTAGRRRASRSPEITSIMNGAVKTNGNGHSEPRRRSQRLRNGNSVDLSSADEVLSPAMQTQATTTRSRHRKTKSKGKALSLDISASQTLPDASAKVKKVDLEIPRKVLHSSIGFLTLALYMTRSSPQPVIKALSLGLCVVVPADILRLKWPGPGSQFAKTYERLLGFLMRESEKEKWNGVIWYLAGVNFALYFYPLDIAVVAILILSWADTAASTIGRLYGPRTYALPPQTPVLHLPLAPRKSSAGFFAACITGSLIVITFYKYIGPLRPHDLSWTFERGVIPSPSPLPALSSLFPSWPGIHTGGWPGLAVLAVVAGLVAGVAEALGK
ncbi:hypothetical protein HWV62_45517 [Athelia sp. TMB]|nr:hypothetical protein HWV62_45517 [Athelia sp. TMB]